MSCKEMVIKWIGAIFSSHIINIIIGNFKRLFHLGRSLYTERYRICAQCSEKEDTPIGEICGLCGCPLKSKLVVDNEKCLIKKW